MTDKVVKTPNVNAESQPPPTAESIDQPKELPKKDDPPKEPKPDVKPKPEFEKAPEPAFKINLLGFREYARLFGRMDSDHFIREHTIRISTQVTLPTLVYGALRELVTFDLPITEDNFIRMWRTLILKRTQDVFEAEKSRRSDHFVRLVRNILVPAPLGDLLHSLGYFHSTKTGYLHHLVQPARASTPENFWSVDAQVTTDWNTTVQRLSHVYTMKEFPSMSQCEARPMMLTSVSDFDNPMRQVRSFTNETNMTDGFVHAMQDQLFDADPIVTYANSHLVMTNPFSHIAVRQQYVYSYAIDHLS